MTTRVRAIVSSTIVSALSLAGLLDLIDYVAFINSTFGINISEDVYQQFFSAVFVSLLLILLTWWTIFFKRKGLSLIFIGSFPGVAIFPILIMFETVTSTIFQGLGQITVAVISSVVFWILTYLLILTANVLNGAILFSIPLGQAGKASQFIFSLVSSYFLIVFLFGSNLDPIIKVMVISAFIFFFSYSATWGQQIAASQAWISSTSITLVMMLATVLMLLWPIDSIYATLTLIVLLYIQLSISLEMREKVGKAIWLEYTVLVVLVILILLVNGVWGINGPIL